MMYQITYLSDRFKVKGYVAFPGGYDIPISQLRDWIERFYGSDELPVTRIASSIQPETQDVRSGKWPVFIYCRGGIGKVGSVKTDWLGQFANIGRHIVFAPCYRGSEGGEGRDEFGGAEREDVFSALRFLQSLPFVDADRIAVMGFSRGSINAALTATELPQDVRKLVLWGGVSDLAQTYEERVELRRMLKRVIGGNPSKIPEAYTARSPICLASRIRCPVLVMHGTQDRQVDFSHGLNMFNMLKESAAVAEMHRYDGYGHHFPHGIHIAAIRRMFEWINR